MHVIANVIEMNMVEGVFFALGVLALAWSAVRLRFFPEAGGFWRTLVIACSGIFLALLHRGLRGG